MIIHDEISILGEVINKENFPQMIAEHKRIFSKLEDSYTGRYEELKNDNFLYGWTWWSLLPKMWRVAKALGFEKFNYEWIFYNTITGYGDYSASKAAQEDALEALREKYPDSILLQNISSCGRLD